METPKLMEIAANYGLVGLLLLGMGAMLFIFARWAKPHLVDLVKAHLELVRHLISQGKKQTRQMRQQTRLMREIRDNGCGHLVEPPPGTRKV